MNQAEETVIDKKSCLIPQVFFILLRFVSSNWNFHHYLQIDLHES